MVPHRQALQLISLTTLAARDPVDFKDSLCRELNVVFPCTLQDYLVKDVYPWLTADAEALLRTTDYGLMYDFRPLFAAAKQLGLDRLMCVTADGPTHNIPSSFIKWRENKSLRVFIETCLICDIAPSQVAQDIEQMYGISVVPEDIKLFEAVFVDKLYVFGNNWLSYMFCIGEEEAKFKQSLIGEPKDYIRWRLGVPVSLDSDKVINRMMSDAYYTIRLLKSQMDESSTPTRDQMARMKFESDVLFKGFDRRLKLAEVNSAAGGGESNTDAAEQIKRIVLDFQAHKHPLKRDLAPTLSDLNKGGENAKP